MKILPAVAALHVARRDVVDDGVAEDVVERALARDVAAGGADDDGKLDLVVDPGRDVRKDRHRRAGADHRGRRLGEEHRNLGDVDLDVLRPRALGDVVGVVAADAEDVLGRARQRRQQPHPVGRDDGRARALREPARRGEGRGTTGDQRRQAAAQHRIVGGVEDDGAAVGTDDGGDRTSGDVDRCQAHGVLP